MKEKLIMSDIIRYPLDLTGTSPDNFVAQEPHTLPNLSKRAFVTRYGPFFTESLKVYDGVTGELLKKKEQYIAAQLVESATVRTGKEICSIIIITDPAVNNVVNIDYQVLGGPFTLSVDALISMLETLNLDERPITWASILGKPSMFPAGHHLHDVGDVYGFEYLVLQLEYVRRAILLGDVQSHDEIYAYIDSIKNGIDLLIQNLDNELEAHITNTNNPHQTTKAQVGLGNLDNFATATIAIAAAGLSNNTFVTPAGLQAYAEAKILPNLNTHIGDKNNPHSTTAAQVGAYSKSESDTLLNTKLGKEETAINSAKLDNFTRTEVLNQAYNMVGSMGKRNLFVSTVAPIGTDGVVGDVWFRY